MDEIEELRQIFEYLSEDTDFYYVREEAEKLLASLASKLSCLPPI